MKITLTKPQLRVSQSDKRFRVLISGRRFGKTFLTIIEMMKQASRPNQVIWYVAPTFKMAKEICWSDLKQMLSKYNWIDDPKQSKKIIEFINSEAKSILKKAGCKVDPNSDNVKMDRNWVMEIIKNAPNEFEIIPRNKKHKVVIGGRHMTFVNVSSPPNVMDLDRGRRPGDFESFKDLLKLTQYFKE